MRTKRARRLLGLLAITALVLGACSSDTVATTVPVTDTTMADGMEDDHDHDHGDAADAIPWDGPQTPTVEVSVTGDPESGWDISADISGLTFSDPTTEDHVPGQGHTHVFIDGQLLTMSYEPVVHVDELDPGPHQAMVVLSRNDHDDYSLNGELIMGRASFTVPGAVDPADATINVMYMDGEISGVDGQAAVSLGDLVDIIVISDVAEEVHLHSYDLLVNLQPGEPGTIRFTADVPGIFEVELEESGRLLFRLQVS